MFGYLDESGAPGKAVKPNDYFVVSLVIFEDEQARDSAISDIEQLRTKLKLKDDYEFHCSRNTNRVQNAFIEMMSILDFEFVTIALKKNENSKTVTNYRIANLLIDELEKIYDKLKIEMDINPLLYDKIRKTIRERGLKEIKIRERNSKNNQLIQVADYVVNISYKYIKNPIKLKKWFSAIRGKCIAFVEISP